MMAEDFRLLQHLTEIAELRILLQLFPKSELCVGGLRRRGVVVIVPIGTGGNGSNDAATYQTGSDVFKGFGLHNYIMLIL